MAASTIYDIRLRYLMDDKATKGVRALDGALQRANRSSGGLGRMLASAGAGLAAFFGARAAKTALIDFNAGMEQARIQMAGLLQLNLGGAWSANMQKANGLVAGLQERAKKSVGTTRDMVDMASMIVRPLAAAGLSMADMESVTAGAVVAARAFGIEGAVAARDIEAALMGNVRAVDRFSRALLEPLGFVGEEGRQRFNQLADSQRAAMLQSALTQKAVMDMASAQEKSFSGVLSTFQDNLQILFGKVGLPLFQALTDELQQWNAWIGKNEDEIKRLTKVLSTGLIDAFKVVKGVAQFLAENAETLMAVAKIWIGMKIGQGVRGLIGAGVGGATSVMDAFRQLTGTMATGVTPGMKALNLALGPLPLLLGGFAMGLKSLLDSIEKDMDRRLATQLEKGADLSTAFLHLKQAKTGDLESNMQRFARDLTALGLLTDKGTLKPGNELQTLIEAMDDQTRMLLADMQGQRALVERFDSERQQSTLIAETFRKDFRAMFRPEFMAKTAQEAAETAAAADTTGKGTAKVNVTINRIEVASDDPDRFVIGMTRAFSDARKNPSAAADALREGF